MKKIPDYKKNPVLREKSILIPLDKINTPQIQNHIKDMKDTLSLEWDGVALAAPQIGLNLRMFVISGKVFDTFWDMEKNKDKNYGTENDLVFINPKIIKTSKRQSFMTEGCLSVRPIYGKVKRYNNVTIEAYDENGKYFTRGAGGLLAQIFQHEIDHLDGVLFIDKAKDLEEVDLI